MLGRSYDVMNYVVGAASGHYKGMTFLYSNAGNVMVMLCITTALYTALLTPSCLALAAKVHMHPLPWLYCYAVHNTLLFCFPCPSCAECKLQEHPGGYKYCTNYAQVNFTVERTVELGN